MNNKKLLVAAIIVILLLINLVNISFKISTYTETISSYSAATPDKPDSTRNRESFDKPYRIVFHGLNNSGNTDTNSDDYIIDVYVEEETSIGYLIFMPIYKPVKISSKGNFKWTNPSEVSGNSKGTAEYENFELNAQLKIIGICSVKSARQEAQNLISKSIQNQIKVIINKKLNSHE